MTDAEQSYVRRKMAAGKRYFVISLSIFFLISVCCLPEPGKKKLHLKRNQTFDFFTKTMNKGYSVAIKGKCEGVEKINVYWRLDVSQCAESFSFLKTSEQDKLQYLWDSQEFSAYSLNGIQKDVVCNKRFQLKDLTDKVEELKPITTEKPTESEAETKEEKKGNTPSKETESKAETKEEKKGNTPSKDSTSEDDSKSSNSRDDNLGEQTEETSENNQTPPASGTNEKEGQRRRREEKGENGNEVSNLELKETEQQTSSNTEKQASDPVLKKTGKETSSDAEKQASDPVLKKTGKETSSDAAKVDNRVIVTMRDGVFVLIVKAEPSGKEKDKDFDLTLNVEMKGQHGYLSASDWPLYPFYGCMSLLYVFYGIVWLIVSACQWRDLLRIQFWIGGVIALGMLEKAVFFSEYNNINITGETNPSLTVFAELVSCVKRTLARILVIIVSMGFGIVKPRLGTTLHRVLGVGALYFILATIEGCFRSLHPKSDPGKQQLIASIPLAVLDASICWWIFMSLVQTTRTLRIRRNLVKLSLYRHFTNTLIFAVLASVAYMIWSIKTHRFAKNGCITDWSELWLDEAFWHFLFSIVLLVIMVLWRPTANNQRYAFTPIVDFGDDDDDDENMTLSDAFDGMKMRNVKNTPEVIINGDTKRKHKPEDDLKWVEENIPSSAADAVLPSVLDSDEELMTTKFEMSKME